MDFSFSLVKKDDLEIVLARLVPQAIQLKTGLALDLDKLPTLLYIWVAVQPFGNQDAWILFPALPVTHPKPLRRSPRLRFGWANSLLSHVCPCEQFDMNYLGRGLIHLKSRCSAYPHSSAAMSHYN